jgi:hypothetical protein
MFKISQKKALSLPDAKKKCAARQMDVLSVETSTEQDLLNKFLSSKSEYYNEFF